MSPFFSKLITPLIEGLFCLLFFLVPLIMTPFNYELFEYNKMMLTYGLTTIIVGLWLLKMVFEKRIIFTRTPFDIFLWLFLASQIVSTVFSIDVHTSVFGYYSRFNGGLLSIISYVLLFHAFVSNLNQKGVRRVFIAIFSGAFLVSGYAILEHFGIDSHLWVQDVRARVFSTLGQPNWLAGYLAVVILLLCGFISNSSSRLRLTTCYLLFAIFYLSLLYTKSRSGITGFWVADIGFLLLAVVGFVRRAKLGNDQAQLGRRILLVNLLFLVISVSLAGRVSSEIFSRYFTPRGIAENAGVFTGNTPPRNLLSAPTGPDDVISDSVDIRKVVWTGALGVFRRYPIFGSGVETFGYSYYQDRPVEHNLLSEWDFLYNKAHNEYLNFLATTGVVGLGTYLLFLAAAGGWMVTKLKAQSFPPSGGTPRHGGVAKLKATTQNSKLQKRDIITMKIASNEAMEQCSNPFLPLAIFSAWFSILLTNFFGFSVVIQNLFLFLLPAMAYVWETENHGVDNHGNNLSLSRHAELDSASGRNKQILPWRDDKRQVRDDRINLFQKILIVSVLFTIYYLLFAILNFWRADVYFAQGRRSSQQEDYKEAYQYLSEAIKLNRNEPLYHDEISYTEAMLSAAIKEIAAENPASESAKQYEELSDYFTAEAVKDSDFAVSVSPYSLTFWKTRTKTFYLLSQIDPQYKVKALEAIKKAVSLAPTDPKVRYNFGLILGQNGETDEAVKVLREAIVLKPNYREPYYALAMFLKENKRLEEGRQVLLEMRKLFVDDGEVERRLREF